MADFLHNDEILMNYLDGNMDSVERARLESELQNDADLNKRLQSLQLAIASVRHYGTAEKVRSIHSGMMQELSHVQKQGKVVPFKRIVQYSLAVAASIIVIIVGVNLFISSSLSSEKLYGEAFVDYHASGVRGNGTETEISKLYEAHNYRAVTEKANDQHLSQEDSLLIGLSYLKSNQVSSSIDWLKPISVQNTNKQDAEFYLALSYLKNKNYNEALALMEQIHSNPNHVYHNQFSDDYINRVRKLSRK